MTELESARRKLPDVKLTVDTLIQSSDQEFAELAHTLSTEDLDDAGLVLTAVTKVSSVRIGLVAYEIRLQTKDGEWGKRVYDLAERWEVSERTIHRWMKSAQEHFQLELTPAQKNAEYAATPDVARQQEPLDEDFDWDDEEEAADAGFAGLDDGPLMDRMNAEAGWGNDTLPPVRHGNEGAPSVTPNPMILEPDDTWVAFTAQSIMQEHEGYSDTAAERSAKARWARKLEEDPLDLLEELEMIYEAQGETLTDEMVIKLHEADEQKALVPDEVTEPSKKRGRGGPKLAYTQAEKLLGLTRELHEHVHIGLRDGTIEDKEVAAMLPHLQPIPHTLANLRKMSEAAKGRYLAENPPMEEKIAATAAAEESDEAADF